MKTLHNFLLYSFLRNLNINLTLHSYLRIHFL